MKLTGPFGWIIDEEGRPINVDEMTHALPRVRPDGVHVLSGYIGSIVIVADSPILYNAIFGGQPTTAPVLERPKDSSGPE